MEKMITLQVNLRVRHVYNRHLDFRVTEQVSAFFLELTRRSVHIGDLYLTSRSKAITSYKKKQEIFSFHS